MSDVAKLIGDAMSFVGGAFGGKHKDSSNASNAGGPGASALGQDIGTLIKRHNDKVRSGVSTPQPKVAPEVTAMTGGSGTYEP